ncbi:purine nucleoside transporter [Schizosaccharomyces cryophilus OY26]|uniref:Purine nucleoside transporter n=1 Tax=Schizosaccharomyces cryophilus (strain OY26 / ATCC MYA-4695 / CBS 11777 / NBRC 106824 / NRRL Y48691) TaxID=653667 RepID=S9W1X6_SCHCR|nr:purine nucleoside transporter [Schizosaccharomyces cryophilus OY26]EPY52035.1 purine nucleoside transporter [Schizosaccharomyces cryophilus OY26]
MGNAFFIENFLFFAQSFIEEFTVFVCLYLCLFIYKEKSTMAFLKSLVSALAMTSALLPASAGLISKRDVVKPKVMVVSMFAPEANAWLNPWNDLYANNITVPGLNTLFPEVHCNSEETVCQVTTGEGKSNAASTMTALTLSSKFDLSETYFLISGIAGINPYAASLASVTVAKYAVDVDLVQTIDLRELPKQYESASWEIGTDPYNDGSSNNEVVYPKSFPYQTNVYQLNSTLVEAALQVVKDVVLEDNEKTADYRKHYQQAAAQRAPFIVQCDTATSDNYWAGNYMGDFASNITNVLTNYTGHYCSSQQEDNASLTAIKRAASQGLVNFNRIILMRSGSDFDRGSDSVSSLDNLIKDDGHVLPLAAANLYHAGKPLVDHIVNNWSYWN